jgi:hypothetical protein
VEGIDMYSSLEHFFPPGPQGWQLNGTIPGQPDPDLPDQPGKPDLPPVPGEPTIPDQPPPAPVARN